MYERLKIVISDNPKFKSQAEEVFAVKKGSVKFEKAIGPIDIFRWPDDIH